MAQTIHENELSTDSYQIEKSFRESRKITVPEFGLTPSTKGKPAIDALRAVLQNWNDTSQIPQSIASRNTISNWRWKVRKYLKGDKNIICSRLCSLVDEYRDYIQEQESKITEELTMQGKPNIDGMKLVIENWYTPHKIHNNEMSYKMKTRFRGMIRRFIAGNYTNIPKVHLNLLKEYKDFLILKKETSKETLRDTDKKMKDILENWANPRYLLTLGYSQVTINSYRKLVYCYLKGILDKVPKHFYPIIESYKKQVLDINNTTKKKFSSEVKAEEVIPKVKKEIMPVIETPVTNRTYNSIQSTVDTVSFITYLKELGVTEFTVKF